MLLEIRASVHGNAWHIVSFSIFGASLVALYAASTIHHSASTPGVRSRLRIFYHALIYVLIAGGVAYTLGAVLYSFKKIPFNHAIFHGFVLLGSASHFIAVYCYVLPTG